MIRQEDAELFAEIKSGNEKSFESLFHRYYALLCAYASNILNSDTAAEEIVQDLFVRLWDKRRELNIESSVKNYLYRSIKNQCFNYIQHTKIRNIHKKNMLAQNKEDLYAEDNFGEPDLYLKIEQSIASLPEKRREIFRLSREEGLKYREIADKLNVSIKTVETQMGLAIKTLREKLKNYNSLFILFCTFFYHPLQGKS